MAYSDTGREKQSGRHETSLISRYWKPAAITAASFTQIFPPCSAACAIRAPGENWRAAENRTASTAPRLDGTDRLTSIRHQSECPADIIGTHADGQRRGAAAGPLTHGYSGRDWWAV